MAEVDTTCRSSAFETVLISIPGGCKGFFISFKCSDRLLGRTALIFNKYRVYFQGIKRVGYDVDHSPPPSVKVKNEWSYNSTPPVCIHAVDRDRLTLLSFFFHLFPPADDLLHFPGCTDARK